MKRKGMNMMATKDFLNKLIQTCPDGIIGIDPNVIKIRFFNSLSCLVNDR